MNIIVVIDYWFPGVGGGPVHVSEITRRLLKKKNLDIKIVTSNLHTETAQTTNEYKPNLPVIHLGKAYPFSSIWGRWNFLWHLFWYLLKEPYDILHVHPFTPLYIAKLVSILKNKPLIVTIHTQSKDTSLTSNKILLQCLYFLEKFLTYKVSYDAQIFVDAHLEKKINVNKLKFYIPNGVDVKAFSNAFKKKEKNFQILFVGRFHPQKNLFALVEAFAKVWLLYPKSKLILIGSGSDKELLLKMIKSRALEESVELLPPVFGPRLAAWYQSSHLFILPSKYEGFPLSLLEAWAAKIPVAATSVGMVGDLIQDGKNGFLIDDSSSNSIAQTIVKAIESRNLSKIGLQGYRMVKKYYTWDYVAQETYKVYKKVLEDKNNSINYKH